jgi:hypothetical protein
VSKKPRDPADEAMKGLSTDLSRRYDAVRFLNPTFGHGLENLIQRRNQAISTTVCLTDAFFTPRTALKAFLEKGIVRCYDRFGVWKESRKHPEIVGMRFFNRAP